MLTSAPVSRPNSLAFTLAMASPITARPSAFATAVTGAIAVYGVLLLSRDHPDALEERRILDEAGRNDPASTPPMS